MFQMLFVTRGFNIIQSCKNERHEKEGANMRVGIKASSRNLQATPDYV